MRDTEQSGPKILSNWQRRAAGVAVVAALSLLVEPSCQAGNALFQGSTLGHAAPAASLAVPAPHDPFTPLLGRASAAAEAAPVEVVAETMQSAPAEAVAGQPATEPEQAPAVPAPAPAPLPAPVVTGWQAPDVPRAAFDPEIEQWRPLVRAELAQAYNEGRLSGGAAKLDDDMVLALIEQESGGDAAAYSWAGAIGLTQVMPFTFADMLYGDESLADQIGEPAMFAPQQNVRAGIRYLAMAMQDFGGNLYWSLSSYNAGIGAVEEWRSVGLAAVPPIGGYVETANYAPAILSNLAAHRPTLAVNVPAPMSDDQVAAAVNALVNAGLW